MLSKNAINRLQELLGAIVSKVELHFEHTKTKGGQQRYTFTHGTFYVTPDAGGGQATGPDSTIMSKSRPILE